MKIRTFLVVVFSMITSLGCGGGGGGGSNNEFASITPAQPVQIPDVRYNVQSAVLKDGVKIIDSGIARTTIDGEFSVDQVNTYQFGQVFIFENKGYKIVGIAPSQVGSAAVLYTTPALLDEIYSDLKFNYTMHPVFYDENGKVQSISASVIPTIFQQLKRIAAVDTGSQSEAIPACILPVDLDDSTEGEYGYKFEIDCSLNQLLSLSADESKGSIHLKGNISIAGKVSGETDLEKNTQYVETSKTISTAGAITFNPNYSVLLEDRINAFKTSCSNYKKKNPRRNFCEVKNEGGKFSATFARGLITRPFLIPGTVVPAYVSIGILFDFEFDANGQITFSSKKYTSTSRVGHINGQKVSYKNISQSNDGQSGVGGNLNGEMEVFLGGYLAGGIGDPAVAVAVEARVDAGIYFNGTAIAEPRCLAGEVGFRLQPHLQFLRTPKFDGIDITFDSVKYNFESLSGSYPEGCATPPGKIGLRYFIVGKKYAWFDEINSSSALASFVINHRLVESGSGNPREISLDFKNTLRLANKPIAFEVQILESSRPAFVNQTKSSLDGLASANSRVVIDMGNATYGDHIKIRVKAFVPGNRAATEDIRDILIAVEPQLAANPFFYAEIDTLDIRGYRMKLDFPSQLVADRVKSGYLEFSNGGQWPLESEGAGWKTDYIGYRQCNGCERVFPVKLVLFTNIDKIGAGQEFPFTEDTKSRVDSIGITPASIKVGDVVSVKVSGRLIPVDAKLEMPNCANIYEVRSFNNKIADNWATNFREFKCDAVTAGEDLISKVTGVGFGIAVYSILADPNATPICVAPQVLKGNVCDTPVNVIVGIPNPANGNRYEIITCGTWTQCDVAAMAKGGNLVTIRSKAENDWILANFGSQARTVYGFWIGQNDLTGLWGWRNGAADKYPNWDVNEPNAPATDHYAHMYTGVVGSIVPGTWNNTDAAGRGLGIVQGIVEYTSTIIVPAASFLPSSVSIAMKVTSACDGGLVLNSAPTDGLNLGDWTIPVVTAGSYRIEVEYSAALSRPVEAFVDGALVNGNALADTTGSWCATPSITRAIGTVNLTAGNHTFRLRRNSAFPHLKEIRFVPAGTGS